MCSGIQRHSQSLKLRGGPHSLVEVVPVLAVGYLIPSVSYLVQIDIDSDLIQKSVQKSE